MSEERQPGMSDEFKTRMRQGLSSMAVRERVRERRRNRAIAGGGVAAVAALVVGVGVWQVTGAIDPSIDQAAPPVPSMTAEPSATPPAPTLTTATEAPEPTPAPPPGFEGVAAGEPIVTASVEAPEGGDTGAGGGAPIEREYEVYVLCEGGGSVLFDGIPFIDCEQFEAGTGWAYFGLTDVVGDGDPQYTATADFDGQLQVVDKGAMPSGTVEGATVTVYYDCMSREVLTIGGQRFDCGADPRRIPDLAAWGVPVAPGSFAPRIETEDAGFNGVVRWLVER